MHRFSNLINPVNLNNPFIQINLISASARSMQLNPILTNFTVTRISVIIPPVGHLLKSHLRNGHGNPRAALRRRRLPRANLAGQARRQGTSMILIERLSSAQSISQVLLKNKLNLKSRAFLISIQVRGLFGNFHAGTTYKVKSEKKHGKVHQNGEVAIVTIRNEDSSEGMA